MNTLRLLTRELAYRRYSFALTTLALAVAAATLCGSLSTLRLHDLQSNEILRRKEREVKIRTGAMNEELRKATLKLSFNLVILPKGQNLRDLYADDFAAKTMPETYVTILSTSAIVTVQHLLPTLQQKLKWPERQRTIILVGTRGETPHLSDNAKKPLIQPVPPGAIVLGHELHRSANLATGMTVRLLGREFRVHKCHEARGNKDDITAWINLREAQELLGKQGLINSILALECLCTDDFSELALVRDEISKILPETQVIEIGGKALARAEARLKAEAQGLAIISEARAAQARLKASRVRLFNALVPSVLLVCGAIILFVGLANVRTRRLEVGILGALGLPPFKILVIFFARSLAAGVAGAIPGTLLGWYGAPALLRDAAGPATRMLFGDGLDIMLASAVLTVALAVLAGWLPALLAARRDPAVILAQEQ